MAETQKHQPTTTLEFTASCCLCGTTHDSQIFQDSRNLLVNIPENWRAEWMSQGEILVVQFYCSEHGS